MRPIVESIEVARELSEDLGEVGQDFLQGVEEVAAQVREVVPECVGLSLAWTDDAVAFTLVATADEIAELDAVQYLESGPCVDVLGHDHGTLADEKDLLDEQSWQLFAQATAAAGIRSTLTLPIVEDDLVVGTVNLYAATSTAFDGSVDRLAHLLGAWAPGVVRNADLSFHTRALAEQAPQAMRDERTIGIAVGLIAGRRGVPSETARDQLYDASHRAGITPVSLARALIELQQPD